MTTATAAKTTDQRIVLSGRTWEQFKLIQKGFEDSAGVRLFYFDGMIETLMPGREHEICSVIRPWVCQRFGSGRMVCSHCIDCEKLNTNKLAAARFPNWQRWTLSC
jgi:hypothetical protein